MKKLSSLDNNNSCFCLAEKPLIDTLKRLCSLLFSTLVVQINLAGFPAMTEFLGKDFVTTKPAPTILLSLIFTPHDHCSSSDKTMITDGYYTKSILKSNVQLFKTIIMS